MTNSSVEFRHVGATNPQQECAEDLARVFHEKYKDKTYDIIIMVRGEGRVGACQSPMTPVSLIKWLLSAAEQIATNDKLWAEIEQAYKDSK